MNKRELVEASAAAAEATKKDTQLILDSVIDVVTDQLAKGQSVSLPRLGTLNPQTRGPRTMRNPITGEAIEVSEKKSATFKPAKALKDAIN